MSDRRALTTYSSMLNAVTIGGQGELSCATAVAYGEFKVPQFERLYQCEYCARKSAVGYGNCEGCGAPL